VLEESSIEQLDSTSGGAATTASGGLDQDQANSNGPFEHTMVDSNKTMKNVEGVIEDEDDEDDEVMELEESVLEEEETNEGKGSSSSSTSSSEEKFPLDLLTISEKGRLAAVGYIIKELGISNMSLLKNRQSAQSRALKWIAKDDEAQLTIPGHDDSEKPWIELILLLQRYALATFYFGLEDPSSLDSNIKKQVQKNRSAFDSEWITAASICDWHGVSCNQENEVVALNLTRCALSGIVPEDLLVSGTLPRLKSLDLSYNQLYRELPYMTNKKAMTARVHEGLDSMQVINLSHNKMTGSIHSLRELKNVGTYRETQFLNYFVANCFQPC